MLKMTNDFIRRVEEAVDIGRIRGEQETTGFCMECGGETDDVEPLVEKATCEDCGEDGVYGAEAILRGCGQPPRR